MTELSTLPVETAPSPFARLRGSVRAMLRHALDAALPPLCPSCREPLGDDAGLCAGCWSKLSFIEKLYCGCGAGAHHHIKRLDL